MGHITHLRNQFKSLHIWLCNIFELIFTLCHKCNKYNCLPWKLQNHAGNSYRISPAGYSYVTQDTVMLYHRLVYLFCILIRSGSRSNDAADKQNKQRSRILKGKEESTSRVFHLIWLYFYFLCHLTYITCLLGRLYQNIRAPNDTNTLARYVTL